jgi:hypothetical protein
MESLVGSGGTGHVRSVVDFVGLRLAQIEGNPDKAYEGSIVEQLWNNLLDNDWTMSMGSTFAL